MECDKGWEIHPASSPRPNKPPPLTVPVWVGQRTVMPLLDMGSLVSLIRAHLVPLSEPVLRYTEVAGAYRQVHRWPVVRMSLGYNGSCYSFEIVKFDDLPFPVLLGWDAPEFGVLFRAALPQQNAIYSDEEEPGPSDAGRRDMPNVGKPCDPIACGGDDSFRRAQEADPTLTKVREEISIIDGQGRDARRAGRVPRFEKEGGLLWRITGPGKRGVAPSRQLIVPEAYRENILRQAHGHLWAGHQGRIRKLARILDAFF